MKTIIHTATPDIEKSKDFYAKLGYNQISEEPVLFTDGKFIVEINPDRFARPGLKMFSDDWSTVTTELAKITHVLESGDGFVACDPNGVWLYLVNENVEQETAGESFGKTGNFSGVSIEAVDIEKTTSFWNAAGFTQSSGDISQGWAVYSNGSGIDVSIMTANMCPHLFFNPGLTFFNSGNNVENIEQLRDAGIPITEEITHFNKEGIVDNVIINDPGGLGFFIFND
jgi:predicted enzyme related to lactoylglutathione lyase